jgi:stage II sporulation protein D
MNWKKFLAAFSLVFLISIAAFSVTGFAANYNQEIRIGLNYGSSAKTSVNVFYDGGFCYGYYQNNCFKEVYSNNQHRFLSVTQDGKRYYFGSSLNLSGNGTAIEPYHVEFDRLFADGAEANAFLNNVKNAGFNKSFIAYTQNGLVVRCGMYSSKSEAENACASISNLIGVPAYAAGGMVNTYTVADMNSGEIVFEFDGNSTVKLALKGIQNGNGAPQLKTGTKTYLGNFEFLINENKNITLINVIDVESYIKGVIPYEMSPSWPIEALKAQAVTARTYAFFNLGKHSKYGFDLCSSTDCQAYGGTKSMSEKTNRAVDETQGKILTYKGKTAQLFYHSSSGGSTENVENVWMTPIDYLVAVPSLYEDLENAINGIWKNKVTRQELTDHLNSKGYNIALVKDIYVSKFTDAGNVLDVTIVDVNGKEVTISKERARIRLSPYVKSQRFNILTNFNICVNYANNKNDFSSLNVISGDKNITSVPSSISKTSVITSSGQTMLSPDGEDYSFVFDGKGWGNNVGMSQHSAKGMAEHGYMYTEILSHFFPGTALENK